MDISERPCYSSGNHCNSDNNFYGHNYLYRAGAALGDELNKNEWRTEVCARKQSRRSLRNIRSWTSPYDHDGFSPLDLLSATLATNLVISKSTLQNSSVMAFGKTDFPLGFTVPNALEVTRPVPVEDLDESITQVVASKYHSMALGVSGALYSWGHGKSGRLGHGNEENHPTPARVPSLRNVVIVSISASDSHSLAISMDGTIFAWGSNSHFQLGCDRGGFVTAPQRVDALKKLRVVGCSAGNTHSICFTDQNEVYAWGSNKCGQLGVAHDKSSAAGSCVAVPKRVPIERSLKQYGSVKIIQASAGVDNTLLLFRPRSKDSMVNEVYQWGNGSPNHIRVVFRKKKRSLSGNIEATPHGVALVAENPTNVIQVCAAKTHNVAVTDAGFVYTWGMGSDQLGHGISDSHLSAPLLIESLLPERGGGRVIHASVCANRTCVVTAHGDLFTWGSTAETGVLGQGASRFTPVPRRVLGIKR